MILLKLTSMELLEWTGNCKQLQMRKLYESNFKNGNVQATTKQFSSTMIPSQSILVSAPPFAG
jgi:hypothetical protein